MVKVPQKKRNVIERPFKIYNHAMTVVRNLGAAIYIRFKFFETVFSQSLKANVKEEYIDIDKYSG